MPRTAGELSDAVMLGPYLLPTFPLGYAWHLVTFKDAYDRLDMYRAEVIIPFGLASMLLQAAILCLDLSQAVQHAAGSVVGERDTVRWNLCDARLVIHDIAGRR
jgi:hypothetical protein